MKALSRAASLAAILAASPALANFSISPTGSTTLFAIDGSNQGTSLCAAASTECASHVNINTAGAPIGVSGTPFFVTGSGGTFPATLNATPSLANGNGVVPTQGGAVLSATNGGFQNILQGNVALSATNGLYSNLLQGNVALSATNGLFANVLQGNAVLSASNPSFASIVQGGSAATVGTYGTAPGAVGALNVNAAITNYQTAATPFSNIAANNTTAVTVKGSAGTLYALALGGIGSVPAYVKLYDATATTCGSGTPKARFIIPANSTATLGAGSNVPIPPQGITFSTGIQYCVTTGIADADTTAPAASTYLINGAFQ